MADLATSPPCPSPSKQQPLSDCSDCLIIDSPAELRHASPSPVHVNCQDNCQDHDCPDPSNTNTEQDAASGPMDKIPLDPTVSEDVAAGLSLDSQSTNPNSDESANFNNISHQQSTAPTSAASSSSSLNNYHHKAQITQSDHALPCFDDSASLPLPPTQPVPLFQYHHSQPGPEAEARSASTPNLTQSGNLITRFLSPTMTAIRRSSMPRSLSPRSSSSDFVPRGRSPALTVPRSPSLRTPSLESPNSSFDCQSSYSELLRASYPQQRAPSPFSLDNSTLRHSIGNNASLMSADKTLDMYRQNVKKTTDMAVQYSFAVFLVSTAHDRGFFHEKQKEEKKGASSADQSSSSLVDESLPESAADLVREAKHILQRLANASYPFAQYYLADGYVVGTFSKGKPDYDAAFNLFVLAAKHGHAESAYRAALCYEKSLGCRRDAAKAMQFLRFSASKNHPGAMTRLGTACLSGDLGEKRYREGIKWMKLATEIADTQYNCAPYQLACLYETGYGDDIFQDENYAAQLFLMAAELGHPEANFRLGQAYEHGQLNFPQDAQLSVHYYTAAAEGDHAAGMMGLCAWYLVGDNAALAKDVDEAFEWARRAAELGYVKAQYAIGYFLETGIGCRRDVLEANVWYVRAADGGDERAKQRLAVIEAALGRGKTVEKPRHDDDKDCVVM